MSRIPAAAEADGPGVLGVSMTATWLDVAGLAALAWWHLPADGQGRGAVVLVPPVGAEQISAHRAMRVTADHLAAAGVAVLRLDLPGTGDSAGAIEQPGVVAAWPDAIEAAVAWVQHAGAPGVVLVGMRLGATLLATAAEAVATARGPLTGLVLWDPCRSGGSFLRREGTLYRLSVPDDAPSGLDPDTVVGPGVVYPPDVADLIRGLRLRLPPPTAAGHVLVLPREAEATASWVTTLADDPRVRTAPVRGQEALVEREPNTALVPLDDIATIVGWVSERLDHEPVPLTGRIVAAAVVAHGPAGEVTERVVREGGLTVIVTEPARPRGATAVFTHAASVYHVGPARHWVRLARAWAGEGYRAVRQDEGDIGDGEAVSGEELPVWYTPQRLDGVRRAVAVARAGGADQIALVGLCSGAWSIVQVARDLQPKAVLLVNPLTWDPAHPPQTALDLLAHEDELPWVERHPAVWRAGQAVKALVGRLGVVPGPDELVAGLVRRGIAVTIVLGVPEQHLYRRFGRRGTRRAILESGRVREIDLPFYDHTLQGAAAGAALEQVLTAALLADVPGRRSVDAP